MKQQEPLGPLPKLKLLDEAGRPLSERIHAIFAPLETRFRLKFNTIQDESILRNLFDRAGQLYFKEEQTSQRIERPEGLAWTILNNLAISELRRSEEKVINGSIAGVAGEKVLRAISAGNGSPEQIVNQVYARQIFAQLSELEQQGATLKTLGFTSEEVATALSMTTAAVDKMMQRIRDRFRGSSGSEKSSRTGGSSS
ncbi:MAG: sigma-70 family RNA polymerase sigma factor [Acidobacteria bacterium]|nr:sigma-70 family RNA polymerase sigma factor [Acidobacteriota bacterium]